MNNVEYLSGANDVLPPNIGHYDVFRVKKVRHAYHIVKSIMIYTGICSVNNSGIMSSDIEYFLLFLIKCGS